MLRYQMPCSDARYLASSSLTPTSTIYRNNHNITPLPLEVSLSPSFESPCRILKLQSRAKGQGLLHVACKDFCPYYIVLAVYCSWYSPTNREDSGVVLAIRGSCHGSSKEPGNYYSIRIQDITPDLDPILSTRLGT
jgi:hypothetical protein